MDPMSIPVLPHLPAAETWRESTYPFASRRNPTLQTLDEALETYENSFRRYGGVSQAYYLALNAASSETERHTTLEVQSAREQAEEAFSRAVHDFEAVDVAFNLWVNSGEGFTTLPEVRELQATLAVGRSVLSAQAAGSAVPRQRRKQTEVTSTSDPGPQHNSKSQQGPSREQRPPGKGRGPRRLLRPPR